MLQYFREICLSLTYTKFEVTVLNIKYIAKAFGLVFVLTLVLLMSACGDSKPEAANKTQDDSEIEFSHKYTYKISDDDESETELLAEYIGRSDDSEFSNFTMKLSRNGEDLQTICASTSLKTGDYFPKVFLTLEDINSDGYTDLIILYDRYAASNTSYNIWIWDSEASAYVESLKGGENIFSNYEVCSKNLVLTNIKDGAASGEYRSYSFNENYEPVLLRSLVYSADESGKLSITVKDFTAGTFLMYSGAGFDSVPTALVYTGLDEKSVSETDAEDAVYRVAGSKSSGASVSCEGFELKSEKGDLTIYYLMRVDKSDKTSAYYLVDSATKEVTLKTSSADLI